MKQKNMYGTATSFLLVAVLAIMAFIRSPYQIWILAGVFAIWIIWMLTAAVLSNKTALQSKFRSHRQKRSRISENKSGTASPHPAYSTKAANSTGLVLLRHVSYRISAYLQSAYPSVTWEWCEKTPERIIEKGGIARIRLFGIPDFNYADVMFDQCANIDCDMLRIVPLAQLEGAGHESSEPFNPPPQQPVDPAVWYDLQGRQILENLVADLHSRGHSRLTIHENGEICIRQADEEVEQDKFKNFPAKTHWLGIARVLEDAGLAATVEESGIVVSW